jgi:hypothetical protein
VNKFFRVVTNKWFWVVAFAGLSANHFVRGETVSGAFAAAVGAACFAYDTWSERRRRPARAVVTGAEQALADAVQEKSSRPVIDLSKQTDSVPLATVNLPEGIDPDWWREHNTASPDCPVCVERGWIA